jgi:hypothetical protein
LTIQSEQLDFEGKYLGSCVAPALGDDICIDSIDKVRKLKQPVKSVLIVATKDSIMV